jgi:hypothetical protein
VLADRSPGRSNRVLPAEVTKRDDICHPDPHGGQHVASRRELYLSPMMCLASRSRAPQAMAYWYRPVRTDVCSMFARMPRYAPGSIRHPQLDADAGDRTEWQLPARASIVCQQFKENKRTEQRTLNPRVRGSSPWRRTLTDLGFYRSRSFHFFLVRFVPVAAPWLLACTDPAIGVCQKRPIRRPARGIRSRNGAATCGRRRPGLTRPMV